MSDEELTIAVCEVLADHAVGAWRPDGPDFQAGETAIFYGAIGETPDRAVGVTVYGVLTDDAQTGLTARTVQVRCRGAQGKPADADALASLVFLALHKLSRRNGIAFAARESFAQLGSDANGRQERTENYHITIDNPEA